MRWCFVAVVPLLAAEKEVATSRASFVVLFCEQKNRGNDFKRGCRKDEIRRTLDSKCAREFFFLSLSLSRTVVIKNICAVVVVVVVAVIVMS